MHVGASRRRWGGAPFWMEEPGRKGRNSRQVLSSQHQAGGCSKRGEKKGKAAKALKRQLKQYMADGLNQEMLQSLLLQLPDHRPIFNVRAMVRSPLHQGAQIFPR